MNSLYKIFLVTILITFISYSQTNKPKNLYNPLSNNLAITLEGGGTVGQTDYKDLKSNYLAKGSLEYYFPSKGTGLFSLRAFGAIGEVSGKDQTFVPSIFNTKISYAGAGVGYSFSFGDIVYPYLAAGYAFTWYAPKDKSGNKITAITSGGTLLNNPGGYDTNPIGTYVGELGVRFMVSDNISLNLSGQALVYTKDYIENLPKGSHNDMAFTGTLGLSYYFGRDKDSDLDGVYDYMDYCPGTPSGIRVDQEGCPQDADGDGVPDYMDKCSNTPKGVKVDANGCPTDADGDGVPDNIDRCSKTPAGVKVDEFGCPLDSDNDGVPDYQDKCPNTPKGVKVDNNGCPNDADKDDVPDYMDKCPNTPSGVQVDQNGCPIQKPDTVTRSLMLKGDTNFETGKSTLLPAAFPALDSLANSMIANPNFKWEVGGHTDSRGSDTYNKKLSEKRAQAVVDYLVRKGVDKSSLEVKAYGESKPLVSNKTAENRAMNRRVEIKLISKNK